jgi:hypothetical protein
MWDYVNAAPEGANNASAIGYRRIRDAAPDGTFRIDTNKGSPNYLPKRIYPNHPEFIEHPSFPNRETYIYADDYIKSHPKGTDYSVRYQSKKCVTKRSSFLSFRFFFSSSAHHHALFLSFLFFSLQLSRRYPWIESVQSYFIAAHNPHDYDVVPMRLPAYHGTGHYIVYYVWRGYMGCIDFEVFDKPVLYPYGKNELDPDPNGDYTNDSPYPFLYNTEDHCQFDTYKRVTTQCLPAGNQTSTNVVRCVDRHNRDYSSGSKGHFGGGNGCVRRRLSFCFFVVLRKTSPRHNPRPHEKCPAVFSFFSLSFSLQVPGGQVAG